MKETPQQKRRSRVEHAEWVRIGRQGTVSVADAGGGKKKDKGGLTGKIVSISDGTITINTAKKGKKKGGGAAGDANTITIKTDASTKVTIDGVAGKSVKDLVAGEKVTINPKSGTATDITATTKVRRAEPDCESKTHIRCAGKYRSARGTLLQTRSREAAIYIHP